MRADRGFALVLVLWALILLTGIGLAFGFAVRVETGSGSILLDQVRAEAAAAAGVRRAVYGLLADDERLRWQADGRAYQMPWADANLRISMLTETGKIDLNYAPAPLLEGLFANLFPDVDAAALSAAVVDWRDRDDRPGEGGAERDAYAALGRPGPANQRLASVDELAQVIGFDAAMVDRLRPHVTVYAMRPRIDALTADLEVLAAVPGLTRAAAAQFVANRPQQADGDARPDLRALAAGARYLESRRRVNVVRIRAEATQPDGFTATVEAVVRISGRGGGNHEILDWRVPLPDSAAADEAGA
ncbi:MAG: type II secretion system protein GspK [Gammaproteobacteria bacterium]